MTNPPKKQQSQADYKKANYRLPTDLHDKIREDAKKNGRSANAELIERLREDKYDVLMREVAEIKLMLRRVLDQM